MLQKVCLSVSVCVGICAACEMVFSERDDDHSCTDPLIHDPLSSECWIYLQYFDMNLWIESFAIKYLDCVFLCMCARATICLFASLGSVLFREIVCNNITIGRGSSLKLQFFRKTDNTIPAASKSRQTRDFIYHENCASQFHSQKSFSTGDRSFKFDTSRASYSLLQANVWCMVATDDGHVFLWCLRRAGLGKWNFALDRSVQWAYCFCFDMSNEHRRLFISFYIIY